MYARTSEEPLAASPVVAKLSPIVGAVSKGDEQFEPTTIEVNHGN
jgi:hypothetical protein